MSTITITSDDKVNKSFTFEAEQGTPPPPPTFSATYVEMFTVTDVGDLSGLQGAVKGNGNVTFSVYDTSGLFPAGLRIIFQVNGVPLYDYTTTGVETVYTQNIPCLEDDEIVIFIFTLGTLRGLLVTFEQGSGDVTLAYAMAQLKSQSGVGVNPNPNSAYGYIYAENGDSGLTDTLLDNIYLRNPFAATGRAQLINTDQPTTYNNLSTIATYINDATVLDDGDGFYISLDNNGTPSLFAQLGFNVPF